LGLEEPTVDIAPDVACVRSLIGQLPVVDSNTRSGVGVVSEVQDMLSLDNLDSLPMPSQRSLEGIDQISTQDLALSQFRITQCAASELSQHEFLCNMHSINPRSPTPFSEGAGQGPWFSRASSVDNNGARVECTGEEGAANKIEAVSDAVEHGVHTEDIASVRPTTPNTSLDDVLASTTFKPDGW
jgi:hypothetical protein